VASRIGESVRPSDEWTSFSVLVDLSHSLPPNQQA
jgi:hypothetical protein